MEKNTELENIDTQAGFAPEVEVELEVADTSFTYTEPRAL